MTSRVLAVDLGATSVRVAAVNLEADEPTVDVLHRWRHSAVADSQGSVRWNWGGIVDQVEKGLSLGLESGPVASIGVDGWGVDYAFIDESGNLIDQPFAYRDDRTADWESVAQRIGIERLYRITGVQLMGINTIFQLAADHQKRIDQAATMLLLPDLLVNHLTGWVGAERSNLSTTGLMDAHSRDWSDDLISEIGLPRSLFPEPAMAGTRVGEWNRVPVHLVGSHDTASAFLGMPGPSEHTVFVSTGSWVIVGVERPKPDTSSVALGANFSNEAGALGGVRFLKNVVGFWILEQCRSKWGDPPIEDLVEEAAGVLEHVPRFDASDHRFISPRDMLSEVKEAANLGNDAPRPIVVRSIIESIVDGVVDVVDEIKAIVDTNLTSLALVGGGSRIPFLAELLASKVGLEVVTGSSEATALGNAIVQGIAIGRFDDLTEARGWLAASGVAA